MKHEIIYTEHYALIVSDEIPNGFYYSSYLNDVRHINGSEYGNSSTWKVIAHRPLTDAPILEGIYLLPKFSKKDDVEKKSKDFVKYVGGSQEQRLAFIDGYLEAKETYKYTKEDLIRAIELAREGIYIEKISERETEKTFEYNDSQIIEIIQQSKRPKYFEYEMARITKFNGEPDYFEPNSKPNPQGQTELVGEYSYE